MEQIKTRQTYFTPDNKIKADYFMFHYSSVRGNGNVKVFFSDHEQKPKVIVDGTLKYCAIELGDGIVKVSKALPMVFRFHDAAGGFLSGGHLEGTEFLACFGADNTQLTLVNPPRNYTIMGSSTDEILWSNTDGITKIYIGNISCVNVTIIKGDAIMSTFMVSPTEWESHIIDSSAVMQVGTDIQKELTQIKDRLDVLSCAELDIRDIEGLSGNKLISSKFWNKANTSDDVFRDEILSKKLL